MGVSEPGIRGLSRVGSSDPPLVTMSILPDCLFFLLSTSWEQLLSIANLKDSLEDTIISMGISETQSRLPDESSGYVCSQLPSRVILRSGKQHLTSSRTYIESHSVNSCQSTTANLYSI